MYVVPLEVGKETNQPSPKVIAGIEFSRYTVVILCKSQFEFRTIWMERTRCFDTASESRSNRSARAFKADRVLRGSNASRVDSSSFSSLILLWTSHTSGWLLNSRGRIEMKGPKGDFFVLSSRGLCR